MSKSKGLEWTGDDPLKSSDYSRLLECCAEVLTTVKGHLDRDRDLAFWEVCQQQLEEIAAIEAQHHGLTMREAEVWRLRRTGYRYQEIAEALVISLHTVKRHLQTIHSKLETIAEG